MQPFGNNERVCEHTIPFNHVHGEPCLKRHEEKMAELVTSVYVEMRSELWEDLERKIAERVSLELQKRSRNVPVRENVSGVKMASTQCNYTSKQTALMSASAMEKKSPILSQGGASTTDFEQLYVQPKQSILKEVWSQVVPSSETQQVRNTWPIQKPMAQGYGIPTTPNSR